jgi:TldD protein
VRVGDYAFDNTNFFDASGFGALVAIGGTEFGFFPGHLPLDDDYREIRRKIWLASDADYKHALETIAAKRAALLNRARADSLPDFSREAPTRTTDEMRPVALNRSDAEALVRELSGIRELARLDASSVSLEGSNVRTRFVNSEGTSYVASRPLVSISATASTRATDGQPLAGSFRFFARSTDALPSRESLAQAVRALAARLDSLRTAPVLERYNGPVLFEGRAAAELFAQVFAPALVGRRRMQSGEPGLAMMFDREDSRGESFTDKIGGRVLPAFLTVVDDPTTSALRGAPVLGGYSVDDEGVPGRRKTLVEAGILRTLLTTRTPVEAITQSSGNRRGGGAAPSNIIVEAARGMSDAELKAEFLTLVRRRGLPFGVLVRELGSATAATPDDPMSIMMGLRNRGGGRGVFRAYRVYADGREELVRGARFTNVDAQSFRDVVAASSTATVHHRFATSSGSFAMGPMWLMEELGGLGGGSILPVASYVVPSLLFEDVSFVKPAVEQPKPPLSPPPGNSLR